jgi:hypothetical protein
MYLRRLVAVLLAVPIVMAVLASFPAASQASIGVGVQAGPVLLDGVAHPGGSYALPPVYVVNTGTEPEQVSIRIERLSPGAGRAVPPSWIQAGPAVQLAPHRAARISLQLTVPGGARSGDYLSDVVAAGSVRISAGQANLGVAAATKLQFRVRPGAARGLWPAVPAAVIWVAAGLLLLMITVVGLRRAGFRIRVERSPAGHRAADRQEGHNEA